MRVLVIAAHPDDETLGVGGTLARHALDGDDVSVCFLTDGTSSRPEHDIELQKRCAAKACRVLGVATVVFGDFSDQRLDAVPLLDVTRRIEDCVDQFQPDVVYTHFKHDVNQDHRVAFHATLVATRPYSATTVKRLLCYESASSTEWGDAIGGASFAPNVFVDISSTLSRKLEALRAYADTYVSEVRPYPHPRSYEAVETAARRYGSVVGVEAAEPFMLVRERL